MAFIRMHFIDDIIYGASRVFNFPNAFWNLADNQILAYNDFSH